MKGFVTSLSIIALLLVSITTLFVFKLPPFDYLKTSSFQLLQNTEKPVTAGKIPTESADSTITKTARVLTYTERLEKGDMLAKNKYYTLAIKEYTLAGQEEPDKIEPYIKIGKVHLENGAAEKAVETFKFAVQKFPENIEAKINLIRALLQNENFTEAKIVADSMQTENQTAFFYQGMIAAVNGDSQNAKTDFAKAVQLNTTSDITKYAENFLNSYKIAENTEGTEKEYLQTLLAKNLNESREFALAIKLLQEVTESIPDYRDAWILLGYAELNRGNYLNAIPDFEKALALAPERTDIRYYLGLAYFGIDNTVDAITQLEIALENGYEPRGEIYQKLAEMYLMQQDYTSSLEAYEKALQVKDEDIDIYVRPIWLLIEQIKSIPHCINLANQGISRHPREAMSYNLLGWCYLASNDLQAAELNFNKGLAIDPGLGAIHLNLGKLHQQKGDLENAKNNYKKAYELSPGNSVGNLAAKLYNDILDQEDLENPELEKLKN